ncbi:MAG: hypothetical protein A3G34_16460 [Candidatus Lindowbacteria bacterium RIFCSPLOWO2_12_FULL_62_27]|nr:MAG: hypothetical protein A3I06_00060 [Candidatus Lindowbacteria bacterium RIFCSPLOWO2_02_FULL_62_12]OGH58333.1 MAG: hypothetical protein A3G34_16460 [Candidatus Lindowbacteria bacterium RIFCSPLOWO2_12_FULL_62_27]
MAIWLCLIGLAVQGCGKAAEVHKVKIGFILATEQEERYQRDKHSFLETAARMGAEVLFLSCDNDENKQALNVETLISRGVKVLVIQPVNSDNAAVFVDKAHEKGIVVIAYDRMINHPALDFYAGQDSFEVGRVQVKAALEWLKQKGLKGRAILCSGQQGHSVAEAITKANREELQKAGVAVAVQQYHDAWGTEQALSTVENALVTYPDARIVLCNNSGMARGAVQAVEKAGKSGQIFISGADADKANVEYILEGKQQQDVYKDEISLARGAADLAAKVAAGQAPPNLAATDYKDAKGVKTILTPVQAIDASNYKAVVVDAGPKYQM